MATSRDTPVTEVSEKMRKQSASHGIISGCDSISVAGVRQPHLQQEGIMKATQVHEQITPVWPFGKKKIQLILW